MNNNFNVSTRKKKKTQFGANIPKRNPFGKYCRKFCKSGQCKNGATCRFIHDIEKVRICKQAIFGKCNSKKCYFSHNLTPDKMPDCLFFLKGCCKADNCNFRHVKVSDDAIVCSDFLKGYCFDGLKCQKSHLFECKPFKKTGTCPKGNKCNLSHQFKKKSNNVPANADPSKYKKVNNVKNNANNLANNGKSNQKGGKILKDNSMLNVLLAKRLKSIIQSKEKIISQANVVIESLPEFISLSTDSATDQSEQYSNFSLHDGIKESKPNIASNISKRKHFITDTDMEKLTDLLYIETDATTENICRPPLKIIPDFLLEC